jgi:hypothetical protein
MVSHGGVVSRHALTSTRCWQSSSEWPDPLSLITIDAARSVLALRVRNVILTSLVSGYVTMEK